MKRLLIGLLAALLTFYLGIITSNLHLLWLSSRWSESVQDRQTERDNIYEAVFRYQMQLHQADTGRTVYFLACSDNNPSDEFMNRFRGTTDDLRRISQVTATHRSLNMHSTLINWRDELILRVGDVRWLSDTEVVVGGTIRQWYIHREEAYLYRLVREADRWRVVETELLT